MKSSNLLKLLEDEHGKPIRSTQVKDLVKVLAKLLPTSVEVDNIEQTTNKGEEA